MPRFCLETNVPASQIPKDFLPSCVTTLSKILGKPEMFCVAFIQTDLDMVMDGTQNEPCGIANVSSIGGLGIENNIKFCNAFFKLVEEYVGIPQNRLWITFQENMPEFVTFKGKSFYHITMCRAPDTPIIHSPDE